MEQEREAGADCTLQSSHSTCSEEPVKDEQTVRGGAPGLLARPGTVDGTGRRWGRATHQAAPPVGRIESEGSRGREGAPGRDGGEGPGWRDWGPRAIQASAVEDKAATPFLEMGMLGADKPGAWGTTP